MELPAPSLPEMLHDASFCCTAQIQLSSLVSAVSLSSESLDSIYTMTLWKAEDLIRVSLALRNSEQLAHFLVQKSLAQAIRLHPFAIDDKLRDGTLASVANHV